MTRLVDIHLPRRARAYVIAAVVVAAASAVIGAQKGPDRCLVPPAIRDAILNEVSGEHAYLHVQMLAATRNRQADEYQSQFFETTYIRDMARQSGLSDVQVELYPGRDVWDAEEGDLWLISPSPKKLASLTQVAAALASGSTNCDIEAEVVYAGTGREADFAGKEVAGKIVLGNASTGALFNSAVIQRGAAGVLGTGSAGVSGNAAGYTLDQVGWASVSPRQDKGGFGFNLSLRQFNELRTYIERGQKVVVKAHVRARTYPSRMNVVSAAIPGSDPNAGELIFVAHSFETISTPGANDNCTGVATLLDIGRTLARLIRDGVLPQPKRTLRFVWGPEISGTSAFMFKHPELQDKLIAGLNFDMTGEDLETTDSYLRMKTTPDSRPSYLNDLIASLLQFVDQTEIRTQTGNNGPFNYRLTPMATITSGSDHSVFLAAGIPTLQFNHWPDNFYHSAEDRIVYTDPTELKRVAFMAGSAFYYVSNAGAAEARDLAWESAANGEKWIAEVTRQSVRLLGQDPAKLADMHKAAQNKVTWAFNRARGGVESVLTLSNAPEVAATVRTLVAALEGSRDTNSRKLEALYRERCDTLGVKPVPVTLTDKEKENSLLVPRRLFKVYSEEAQKRQAGPGGGGGGRGAGPGGPPPQGAGQPGAPQPPRMPGLASSEVTAFVDGQRSILDIYNAVRAECGHLTVGNSDQKFAYVLSPDNPDIELDSVIAAIRTLEKNGVVQITKVAPTPPQKTVKKIVKEAR